MIISSTHLLWLALALLAYCLVTGILLTLAVRSRYVMQRHELILETKRLRMEYYRHVASKKAQAKPQPQPEGNVDIVEPGDDDYDPIAMPEPAPMARAA